MKDLTSPLNDEHEGRRSRFDTEVIRLQNFDNFYSLMDKLHQRDEARNVQERTILVWPIIGRVLDSQTDFGRLRGWAARHHHAIALVIPKNDLLTAMAKEQGLPVFTSVKDAEAAEWDAPEAPDAAEDETTRTQRLIRLREEAERAHPQEAPLGTRLIFFVLAILSVTAALFAILPQARVEITPYYTKKTVDMSIWTNDTLSAVTLTGGIPTVEKEFTLDLSAEVDSSGTLAAESPIAVGTVRVTNTCDRASTADAGVILSTSEDANAGIRFTTIGMVSIPAGASVNIRVEAVSGGSESNVPAGSIRYVQYPESLCWQVEQPDAMSGGSDGIYASPIEADRDRAAQAIREQIPGAVEEAMAADPESDGLILLGEPTSAEVVRETVSPGYGYVSDTLTVQQTLKVRVKAVYRSDMEALITAQSRRLDAQTAGLTDWQILAGPTERNGLTVWDVRAEYLVYEPETNEEALQTMLRGKTLSQARAVLDGLEHIKTYRVSLLPSWMPLMPLAAQNIDVRILPATEAEP